MVIVPLCLLAALLIVAGVLWPRDGSPGESLPRASIPDAVAPSLPDMERQSPSASSSDDRLSELEELIRGRTLASETDAGARTTTGEREENLLQVRYGSMPTQTTEAFPASFAFWAHTMLVLVFRNYEAPSSDYEALPPAGRACLVIMLRKGNSSGGFDEVTTGTYEPGVLQKGIIYPPGATLLTHGSAAVALGVFWRVSEEGQVKLDLGPDIEMATLSEIEKILQNMGSVTLTTVGHEPGDRVAGELSLGIHGRTNIAMGKFSIPVVPKPNDFAQ